MTTPQATIYNVITSEVVTRDFNETELAQLETDQAQAKKEAAAKIQKDEALANKRQIILDRLGITHEELKAILS